jgi:trk system potassium uptake protein TrkH
MHPPLILKILAYLLWLLAAFLFLPLGLAVALGENVAPFLGSVLISVVLAAVFYVIGRQSGGNLSTRDGFLTVALGWIAASLVAALPYLISGELGVVDAVFEAVSGITTTGSTILDDVSVLPESLVLWRSLTQWLGGMGIILFTIAVLPLLGVGGMQLFRAEVPGPVTDKISPRLAVTARYLWGIYCGLTLLELLLLLGGGMPLLDAVNHSFTTLATGGFSPENASIAAYDSHFVRWVVIVFMFLAGTNFVLHFKLVTGHFREVSRDEEFRWYGLLLLVFVVLIAASLWLHAGFSWQSLEDVVFTVVALMTTTGYAVIDYHNSWPVGTQGMIVLLLVLGGMAGSTGGGVKTLRTLLAFRALKSSFLRISRPHAVKPVPYRDRPVPEDVMTAIWGFFAAYLGLAILGMIALNLLADIDLTTSWSASLTAIGNVGPGLGAVGPAQTFAHLPVLPKLVLAFLMLCGRLEVYTVLLVLMPSFWRR